MTQLPKIYLCMHFSYCILDCFGFLFQCHIVCGVQWAMIHSSDIDRDTWKWRIGLWIQHTLVLKVSNFPVLCNDCDFRIEIQVQKVKVCSSSGKAKQDIKELNKISFSSASILLNLQILPKTSSNKAKVHRNKDFTEPSCSIFCTERVLLLTETVCLQLCSVKSYLEFMTITIDSCLALWLADGCCTCLWQKVTVV